MVKFTIRTTIQQEITVVERALLNPDNHPYWTTDLEKFEAIEGQPGEVGSIAHLHYKGGHIMVDKLLHVESGRKYVSEVSGPYISAKVETLLSKVDDGTKIFISWTGKAKRFPLKIMFPFIRRKLIKLSTNDLRKFKELVEKRGENFNKT